MSWHETTQAVDGVIATAGQRLTFAGSAGTFLGWLLSSQGAALIGIFGILGGLWIQWYFKRRQDRREEAEHRARMGLYQ